MANEQETHTINRLSSASVREATGRGWDEWLAVLDGAGAADMDHKGIVAHLARTAPHVSGWWQQAITVGYEQARGKRAVGQTADAGFQVGVSRSVAASVEAAWSLLTAQPELWLGPGADVVFEKGARYRVPPADDRPAAGGEVRVVKPGDRVRMTWQPHGWAAPATLQVTLSTAASGKTVIGVHFEKLPDAAAREAMRERWRGALERIAAAL